MTGANTTTITGMSHARQNEIARAIADVLKEYGRAKNMFPVDFHNHHEAYAVILEEIDELWTEIKKKQLEYNHEAMHKEAVQCCAMILRFLVELSIPNLSK